MKYSLEKNNMIPLRTVESSQRSWAFFPSKGIIFGCFNSFAFQACQEDDPCYQPPPPPPPPPKKKKKKKLSYHSFLEGKCHLDLNVALNFYANIILPSSPEQVSAKGQNEKFLLFVTFNIMG